MDAEPLLSQQRNSRHSDNQSRQYEREYKQRLRHPRQQKHKALQILAYRALGKSFDDIAPLVGLKNAKVCQVTLYTAQRKGWLTRSNTTHPDDVNVYLLAEKASKNVEEFLDQKDKDVSVTVWEKTFAAAQQQTLQQTMMQSLSVSVVMPEGGGRLEVRAGTIAGTPIQPKADDGADT